MTLPYTWTDPDTGAKVTVDAEALEVTLGGSGVYATAPRGDDARALAGAVLDAGGVECSIIPADELERLTQERDDAQRALRILYQQRADLRVQVRDAEEKAAQSMRDRADQAIQSAWPRLADRRTPAEQCGQVVRAVRALPLLADTDLPAEDLDEPDNEMPTLASLDARLHAVEQALAARPRLVVPPGALDAPAQLRDAADDLWERDDAPMCLELSPAPVPGGYPYMCERDTGHTGDHAALRSSVTWAATLAEPTPCEVCGRAPADQEHGPDGRCRHTSATRLGKPAGGGR